MKNLISWSVLSQPDLSFSWSPDSSHLLWVTGPDFQKGVMLAEDCYHLESAATGPVVVFDKFYVETAHKVSLLEAQKYGNRVWQVRRFHARQKLAKCSQVVAAICALDAEEALSRITLFIGDPLLAYSDDHLARAMTATIQTTLQGESNGTAN